MSAIRASAEAYQPLSMLSIYRHSVLLISMMTLAADSGRCEWGVLTGPDSSRDHDSIGTADAKLILVCTPGGFERFFDETAKAMLDKAPLKQMDQIMAKYGCDPLGPPLFPQK